ncbi:hypothetical protein IFM89_004525 [Coptis chinensis]|uniref:Uncharacterized protein n=1 Tax=Coptis chinensis TaxID=261450 RepID=A0A835LA26_9MAGN|nr:hypothetical protein IFM89_004525 [Coptis chinensis]
MRSRSSSAVSLAALFALALLLLLHMFVCSFYGYEETTEEMKINQYPSRKLLRVMTSASNDVEMKYHHLTRETTKDRTKKAVETSLKIAPPSIPNPTQNK